MLSSSGDEVQKTKLFVSWTFAICALSNLWRSNWAELARTGVQIRIDMTGIEIGRRERERMGDYSSSEATVALRSRNENGPGVPS